MTNLETKIIAHHVGGRGFGVAFNPPNNFKADIVHILYEADPECMEEMNRNSHTHQAHLLGELQLLPYCLGRSRGKGRLNITANAYASSLLAPDPSFFNYYCEMQIAPALYDVTYDDMLEVVKKVDVEIHSLDQLFEERKLPASALPDFLSLDTQGLERDIMEGAQDVIRQGVVGIVTEVEIAPMYKEQPLLGDVLQLMNRNGFHFAGFTCLYEISPNRAPIGLRGKSFPGFGDALFLRKVETLSDAGLSGRALFLKTVKLAFIALVFGYVEYALKALQTARSLRKEVADSMIAELDERAYWQFLLDVERAVDAVEPVYPPIFGVPQWSRPSKSLGSGPTWSDAHHEEAVRQYYLAVQAARAQCRADTVAVGSGSLGFGDYLRRIFLIEPSVSTERLRKLALTRPHKAVAKAVYYLFRLLGLISNRAVAQARQEAYGLPQMLAKRLCINEEYSVFESVLSKHGLGSVADNVRQKRIAAECFVRSLDPELRAAAGWDRPCPVKQK